MKLVEQAIFTSVDTDREVGYRVVAATPGLCADDARELSVWEPLGDSLIDAGPYAESINFHPLPSGSYCVSRSTLAGWEHGGGRRIHTHCLIVPPEVLLRFANNPIALAGAMYDHGLWQTVDHPHPPLLAFSPPGGATSVDQNLLNRLALDPGPGEMAQMVQLARDSVCLAVSGASRPDCLIAGLFSCLPIECRLEFSFTTGMKFSPRRAFRIVALSGDNAERLWVAGYPNVTVLELGDGAANTKIPIDGWSRLIERSLATDHVAFLAGQILKRRGERSLEDLPALGLQLLECLDANELRHGDPAWAEPAEDEPAAEPAVLAAGRADAAHKRFEKTLALASAARKAVAAPHHGLHPPEVLEKLEYLDDLVYEAIGGDVEALEKLCADWPRIFTELGEDMLLESREQYLRYAISIWDECAYSDGRRNPERAIQALDVLSLLFGDGK